MIIRSRDGSPLRDSACERKSEGHIKVLKGALQATLWDLILKFLRPTDHYVAWLFANLMACPADKSVFPLSAYVSSVDGKKISYFWSVTPSQEVKFFSSSSNLTVTTLIRNIKVSPWCWRT